MTRDDQIQFVDEARKALESIRSGADFDRWHDIYGTGEAYIHLPTDLSRQIDDLAERGRQRAMSFTFPLMAG